MSQADVDAFVDSAWDGTLKVPTAVVTRRSFVNGRHSRSGFTALQYAVLCKRPKVVVALLAAGGDANVRNRCGETSVLWGAYNSTIHILQLLMDGGGSVNNVDKFGQTPLITLVRCNKGEAAARLEVLLACPELDLNAEYDGKTAEQWAIYTRCDQLAVPIAAERARRERWGGLRAAWIAALLC
jgi:hypothetical protein